MSNTIDESTAIAWTTAARTRMSTGTTTRAYLIPLDDLQGAIDEIKNQGGDPMARAYLAYGSLDGKDEDKLVIVGTTQEASPVPGGATVYKDMIPSRNPTSSIWDFTEPCPQACDGTSPLNS